MSFRRVFLATLAFAAGVAAADFNGEWTASIETQIGVQNYTFMFKVDGEKMTGRAKSAFAGTIGPPDRGPASRPARRCPPSR
jgi:hypothetical protein